jgi:AcrR family transcriptional regulator
MTSRATDFGPTPRVSAKSPVKGMPGAPELTPRGKRTLEKIVTAAEVVFTRQGFLESRMSDIAQEAGVAHGTVYSYFDCKEDVFLAVASRAVDDILARSIVLDARGSSDPEASLRVAAESVVTAYQEHAAILGSLAIVASFDERASTLRHLLTVQLIERADRVIKAFQRAGLADPDLNRPAVATALGAMAESLAYMSLVQEPRLSRDEISDALALVWVRAIGLTTHRSA